MIAILCPVCGGDTQWRYVNGHEARRGVPGLSSRCYRPMAAVSKAEACDDPSGHLAEHRARQEGGS